MIRCAAYLLLLTLSAQVELAGAEETIKIDGDWIVRGEEAYRGKRILLDGSLILPKSSKLILTDCSLEITGEYSRQHSVEWQGGALLTTNCTVGGHVNEAGTAIHTVFHLYDGLWEATNTTVAYSYGISFHWEKGKGILRGNRLKAGPRPDAIILSGEADVHLVDSDFPIGIGVYCNKGGETTLDLSPHDSLTTTFDRSNLLPGVDWKLRLENTRVHQWFLFLRRIGDWQPPAKVTVSGAKNLIVSLFVHNLSGEVELTNDLETPLEIGNLTLSHGVEDSPEGSGNRGISMYAMYFSGAATDATIRGQTHICEWMQSGGTVRVGPLEKNGDLTFGCTTLELSGEAKLIADGVHFGRPLTWQPEQNIGEANVKGSAHLVARDISTNNLRMRTEGSGRVEVSGLIRNGTLDTVAEGGPIELNKEASSGQARQTKPKVWIYTDMSDPQLPGGNHRGTINDPDDVSAMAGYLLMANEFETLGIVVASTHRNEHKSTPDQAKWARRLFGDAYQADLQKLNQQFEGYPKQLDFVQSCIKETGEKFTPTRQYESLATYPTVASLLNHVDELNDNEVINVLCWGSLTEPAILVAHCHATQQTEKLKHVRFIAHWTNSPLHQGSVERPGNVANCREDAAACAYMKRIAASGAIRYYECGAIGQHGIVSGGPKGKEYFDQFRSSKLGTIFVDGKYVHDGVDHSDAATYWVLLGEWGVDLDDIAADGTNSVVIEKKNEAAFRAASHRIHDELLSRSRSAAP